MKKGLLFIGAATMLLASCKKDYSCTCKTTVTETPTYYSGTLVDDGYTSDSGTEVYSFSAKKKDAESKCKTYESTSTSPGYTGGGWSGGDITYTTTCTSAKK